MKTILYMSLTANGYLAQPDESHPIPSEIFSDFLHLIGKTGNLVVGRRTHDLSRGMASSSSGAHIERVIVSRVTSDDDTVVASPIEALHRLEGLGFTAALVGGGAALYASFLSDGLVDELYLNIEPIVTRTGIPLDVGGALEAKLGLIGSTTLGSNVVQMHYIKTMRP
jgi:dihydrofolate reductase